LGPIAPLLFVELVEAVGMQCAHHGVVSALTARHILMRYRVGV